MSKNDLENIKNSISRYLSMREHSKQELADKLLKKNYEKTLVMQCIEEFSEKDLQSDYRYAESFVRSKFNDHKGENFIRSSLRNKGISSLLIDKIMLDYDQEDWLQKAILALEKKVFKSNLDKSVQIKKQNAFLNSRGFTFKVIDKAINQYWKL
jgi:regulatory protein